jgi:hypothetical protein
MRTMRKRGRALHRRYGHLFGLGGPALKVGDKHRYKGWTIRVEALHPGLGKRGEFDVLDGQGRKWGSARSWTDAIDLVDEKQHEAAA